MSWGVQQFPSCSAHEGGWPCTSSACNGMALDGLSLRNGPVVPIGPVVSVVPIGPVVPNGPVVLVVPIGLAVPNGPVVPNGESLIWIPA